jgi:hypothetical protein
MHGRPSSSFAKNYNLALHSLALLGLYLTFGVVHLIKTPRTLVASCPRLISVCRRYFSRSVVK